MFSSKNLILSVTEVPDIWIFSNYCNIPLDNLSRGRVIIRSLWNINERTPSMCIYCINNKFKFKDFSSGKVGDGINLVEYLFNLTYTGATEKIVNDYNQFILFEGTLDIPTTSNVPDFNVKVEYRSWNILDKEYWLAYGITSEQLEKYKVRPISSYHYLGNGKFEFSSKYIYGYHTKDDKLYKIYQPFENTRFLSLFTYIQGSQQCKHHPYLIYQKSLKDVMALDSFGLNLDAKAPASENSIIPKYLVDIDLKAYKKVFTWFDPDKAGINAANQYKELYGIEPIFLCLGQKDLTDHIKKYGRNKIAIETVILINKHLNKL